MEVHERRPVVRNTAVKPTVSPDEVVEIRRRMARKSTPMPAQAVRSKRATAELYLDSCDSAQAVAATPKKRKLAVVGASVAAAALVALGVVLAG